MDEAGGEREGMLKGIVVLYVERGISKKQWQSWFCNGFEYFVLKNTGYCLGMNVPFSNNLFKKDRFPASKKAKFVTFGTFVRKRTKTCKLKRKNKSYLS